MFNIAIFASGSGSNAENVINYFVSSDLCKIKLILSNKSEAYVHQRAKKFNIESASFSKSEFEHSNKVLQYLHDREIDFIILAGFLLKVPRNIIESYPNRIINIHPALLPKFGGKGMYGDHVHKAVVNSGETESGITIHYINENYDEGNVIYQAKCDIFAGDTYENVADKVHQLEYKYFPCVIEKILFDLKK